MLSLENGARQPNLIATRYRRSFRCAAKIVLTPFYEITSWPRLQSPGPFLCSDAARVSEKKTSPLGSSANGGNSLVLRRASEGDIMPGGKR